MLELRHISKAFPGVRALDDVSLEFRAGEIHGLVGENGAGKSTLIKIVTGIYRQDGGEILLDGAAVDFANPHDSLARGIALVHQEICVVPDLSVAENILIDRLPARAGVIRWTELNRLAGLQLQRVGLDVPLDRLARHLSVAQKQLLQIAQALAADARVLFLDEPTSALTEHEARRLFGLLRELRGRGCAIIFVSHRINEVLALCDRVSALRDGRLVGTRDAAGLEPRALVQLMIGRENLYAHFGQLAPDWSREVLRAEDVTRRGKARGISFTLHQGEILGFYGLIGSGRTELARILIGDEPLDNGQIFIRGQAVHVHDVGQSLYTHRLGYVSENRKEEGLFLDDSVQKNLTLPVWPRLRHAISRCIDAAAEAAVATRFIDSLQIKTPSADQRVGRLSGGNQQKVSLGKWLAADCDILIIDEPTIGVDVGAKEQIHQLIWNLAARDGKSVIVISSDLPEIVRLTNRLLVFREQRIVGEVRDIDTKQKNYAAVSAEIAPWFE